MSISTLSSRPAVSADDGVMNDSEPGPRAGGPTRRRVFTPAEKLAHLAAYDLASEQGQGGAYLRAEGLLNDAIKNLAEKDGFDLTTAQQRTRYRQACHDCSTAYGNLSRRTGRESMLLRAGLLRLGLPLYRIFLKHKT